MPTSDREPFERRLESSLRRYWFERLDGHFDDSYAGVRLLKFPEDLRVYEHLLWEMRADTVIEIGSENGGSALWFRDRLLALTRYGRARSARVLSIDVEIGRAREALTAADPTYTENITLMDGDVRDPELPERVRAWLGPDARSFVVEDSAHMYDTTLAALSGFARFVPSGGWFVIEDGCVDVEALRPSADWPRGVQPAIADWLASDEGSGFVRRRDVEAYGLTCHPGGFLQRRR